MEAYSGRGSTIQYILNLSNVPKLVINFTAGHFIPEGRSYWPIKQFTHRAELIVVQKQALSYMPRM
jgi:hypothetical protein